MVETIDDVYEATNWIGAFIGYEATPLNEVAREFESRFGVDVEIVNPELDSRTITGWFASQSPIEMFDNICLAVDARCEVVGEVLRVELSTNVTEAAPGETN